MANLRLILPSLSHYTTVELEPTPLASARTLRSWFKITALLTFNSVNGTRHLTLVVSRLELSLQPECGPRVGFERILVDSEQVPRWRAGLLAFFPLLGPSLGCTAGHSHESSGVVLAA